MAKPAKPSALILKEMSAVIKGLQDEVPQIEFFRVTGHFLSVWQIIEGKVFSLFWQFVTENEFDVASTIFTHIRAFDQRCVLTDRIVNLRLAGHANELEQWKALLKRLQSLGRKRDRIVHYQFNSAGKGDLFFAPPMHDYARRHGPKAVKPTDSEHYMKTDTIKKAASDAHALFRDLDSFLSATRPICNRIAKQNAQGLLRRLDRQSSTGNPQSP